MNDVDDWDAIIYQGEKAYKKYKQIEGWEKKQKIKQFLFRRGFTIDLIERFLTEYEEEKG
ncbi:MAG: RecX family transcriptional regulator [Bacillaceae bacterium]|nr:RecX family transcriptional regulator [Bacillaceae bacterium]